MRWRRRIGAEGKLTHPSSRLGNRSAYERRAQDSLRLSTVDEERYQPNFCKIATDEELRGAVVSGHVKDHLNDQGHAARTAAHAGDATSPLSPLSRG